MNTRERVNVVRIPVHKERVDRLRNHICETRTRMGKLRPHQDREVN